MTDQTTALIKYRLEAGSELIAEDVDHPYAITVYKADDVEAHLRTLDAQLQQFQRERDDAIPPSKEWYIARNKWLNERLEERYQQITDIDAQLQQAKEERDEWQEAGRSYLQQAADAKILLREERQQREGAEDRLSRLTDQIRSLESHSTREIVQGRRFGHNPSWIKVSDLAALLSDEPTT